MATGGWFGADEIKHFDGGLFDDDTALALDSEGLDMLARVAAAGLVGAIEPTIFGTLFERSLDPGKRAQLGAHYTGKEDILLIVEPVLMAPLRRRWEEVQGRGVQAAAEKRDAGQAGRSAPNLDKQLRDLLLDFADRAGRGPACWTRPAAAATSSTWRCAQLLDLGKEVHNLMLRRWG